MGLLENPRLAKLGGGGGGAFGAVSYFARAFEHLLSLLTPPCPNGSSFLFRSGVEPCQALTDLIGGLGLTQRAPIPLNYGIYLLSQYEGLYNLR